MCSGIDSGQIITGMITPPHQGRYRPGQRVGRESQDADYEQRQQPGGRRPPRYRLKRHEWEVVVTDAYHTIVLDFGGNAIGPSYIAPNKRGNLAPFLRLTIEPFEIGNRNAPVFCGQHSRLAEKIKRRKKVLVGAATRDIAAGN